MNSNIRLNSYLAKIIDRLVRRNEAVMMKYFCFGAVAAALLSVPVAAAELTCPAALVDSIQVQDGNYLIRLEGQGWKQLSLMTGEASQARLAVALAAQSQGKKLILVFNDSETPVPDCSADQYWTTPIKLRLGMQ